MHDCGSRNLVEVAESGVLAADLTGTASLKIVRCDGIWSWERESKDTKKPKDWSAISQAYLLLCNSPDFVLSWFLPAKIWRMGKQYPEVWEQFIKTGLMGLRNKEVGAQQSLVLRKPKRGLGIRTGALSFVRDWPQAALLPYSCSAT